MSDYLKFFRLFLILMVGVLYLTACGGGTGADTTQNSSSPSSEGFESNNTQDNNSRPTSVKLVGVTATNSDSIQVEWLSANDANTTADKLIYEVHISKVENFQPSSTTKKTEVTNGKLFTTVTGLEADTLYHVNIVAVNEQNLESWSNELSVTTFKTASKKLDSITLHEQNGTNPIVEENSLEYTSTITPPSEGDFIVGEEGSTAYLRKVSSVLQKDNGHTLVSTEKAVINEVFEKFEVSSSFKMVDVDSNTVQNATKNSGLVMKNQGTSSSSIEWESGLRLSSSHIKNENTAHQKVSQKSQAVIPNQEINGTYKNLILPSYVAMAPNTLFTTDVQVQNVNGVCIANCILPASSRTVGISKVCSSRLVEFTHPDEDKSKYIQESSSRPVITYTTNTENITIGFQSNKGHISDKPYTAKYQVDIGTDEQCQNNKYEERMEFEVPFFVSYGDLEIKNEERNMWDIIDEDGKKLSVDFGIGFEPDVTFDAYVTTAGLQSAKSTITGALNIQALIDLELSKEFSKSFEKLNILKKEFHKVFVIGGVPVYVNGEFSLHAQLEVEALGALNIEETFDNTHTITLGLEYDKAKDGWEPIDSYEKEYIHIIKSTAHGDLKVTLSLVPNMKISLYKMVATEMLVKPYIYSDMALEAQGNIYENLETGTDGDVDYAFNKFNIGAGVNGYFYAGAGVFDYTIASFPDGIKYGAEMSLSDKFEKYEKVTFLSDTTISKLPELVVDPDVNDVSEITDSRTIKVSAHASNENSSLYEFKAWIEPKALVSRYNEVRKSFVDVEAKETELSISYADSKDKILTSWVVPKKPYQLYKMRVRGYSKLGSFFRQAKEITIDASDNDGDSMADYWEERWDVTDPNADPDKDCRTNLQEYEAGTFPKTSDSGENCSEKEVLNTPQLSVKSVNSETLTALLSWTAVEEAKKYILNVGSEKGKTRTAPLKTFELNSLQKSIQELELNKQYYATVVAQNDTLESNISNEVSFVLTKEHIVSLNLGSDIVLEELKTKIIPFTIVDTGNQISTIGCSSTPLNMTFSNSNTKLTVTAPSYDSTKEFIVKCIAHDSAMKLLDSDEVKITVTPKSSTNNAPTVSLPPSTTIEHGKSYPLTPTVTDEETSSLTYQWSVVWNGAKGSTSSTTGSTSTLTPPILEAGESGSATVTLMVTDSEGLTDTDSKTYSYSFDKEIALQFIEDNFNDGEVLARGSSKVLTWKIKNVSNVDLKNISLIGEEEKTSNVNVGSMEPSSIATWLQGETKTFTTTVHVPNDVTESKHKYIWYFYHNTNQALPYKGHTSPATIFFESKTTNPNDLVGRLITDKKLVTPNEAVSSLVEITSGNAPYKIEVDWGDGTIDTFDNVEKNSDNGMTKSLTHSYGSENSYTLTVKVVDSANKEATFVDVIEVKRDVTQTSWQVDVHDIKTDERESNIDITVEDEGGYGTYTTSWSPTTDTQSQEYFVKYRLAIPSKLLMLDKKMRVTVKGMSSDIEEYDREINFRTSDSMEYTASIRHKDFEETLNGETIKGGYFTTKNLSTGEVLKEKAEFLNSHEIELDGYYAMATTPNSSLNVYKYHSDVQEYVNLKGKTISLNGNWLTELDLTFKGNGALKAVLLEYDLNGDGEFSSDEKLILNTVEKSVDWSQFSTENNTTYSTSKLKKTGQTKSYDQSGNEVTDGSQKDDGYYQKGATPSYTRDDAKEVVTDNLTGLMWQDDTAVAFGINKPWVTQANYDAGDYSDTTGDTATTYCTELVLGGYEDWRLPTRKELISLSDYGSYDDYLAINFVFVNTNGSAYWSSTTHANNSNLAWFVSFHLGLQYYSSKYSDLRVKCVRGEK